MKMAENNNTEKAILDAAEEIFLEKGYNGASTTRIAEKAGVTHAMLHYYFRSKEKIFLKILDKTVDEMLSSLSGSMSSDAGLWQTMEKVIRSHFDFMNAHRRYPFLMLNVAETNPEMLEKYKRRITNMVTVEFGRHKERMEKWIEEGEINDIDPLQLLFTIISLNLSSFTGLAIMQNVLKIDESAIDAFLEKRKEEIVKTIHMRLYSR